MYAPGRRWRPQQEPANPSNNHFNFKKEYFIMKSFIFNASYYYFYFTKFTE